MPELPEVETVKRIIEPLISGHQINGVSTVYPHVLAYPAAEEFIREVQSATITGMDRRGKFLIINLDIAKALILHLRMTGQLFCTPADEPRRPHTHVIFHLNDGKDLRFVDLRRFGRFWLEDAYQEETICGIHKLGVEPFDEGFCAAYLEEKLGKRNIAIKQGLLDQAALTGLGNIYADEVLFTTKVNPGRAASKVKKREWKAMAEVIPPILEKAIERNLEEAEAYLQGTGREYREEDKYSTYGREGKPCLICGTPIKRIKLAGRSSYYCPKCQK